ncbi:MAG: leucine-rich repeat protein [Crocinitomicaceae bacterium]|jgi:hypothetical protein|nr:leucine-rich repeat protein [Crocinitomicaceae bacterium]
MGKKAKILIFSILTAVVLIAGYIIYANLVTPEDEVVAYKPNIYLYPEKETDLIVGLSFPKGGRILKSIPIHHKDKKWQVRIKPNGKINNRYDFLFYESMQPDKWQRKSGWLVKRDTLKAFFEHNMKAYGFNQKEITDFTEYWKSRLTGEYYLVYPQENKQVDRLIKLSISVPPDNVLRLQYFITTGKENSKIRVHKIPKKFKREAFHICEWGVLIKK